MAQVTITIDDALVADYLNAFEEKFDYDNNKLNGESRANFARRKIAEYLKSIYIEYKINQWLETRVSQLEADKSLELSNLNSVNIT